MASEWIKFMVNTPEKQEVLSITVDMGWDDPDLTVGKLLRVWRWFDQHTIEGNAINVTVALLDRIIGVSGFAKAMAKVGWLEINEDGLRLPNFEKHNGPTAKQRAQTAQRVANYKANKESNADSVSENVSDALPRKEKKRKEKIEEPKVKSLGASATPLPKDWEPSVEDLNFCQTQRPDLNADFVASRFRDYWIAKPGKDGTKKDWPATWRNWVRNEKPPAQARASPLYEDKNERRRRTIEQLTGVSQHSHEYRTIDITPAPLALGEKDF